MELTDRENFMEQRYAEERVTSFLLIHQPEAPSNIKALRWELPEAPPNLWPLSASPTTTRNVVQIQESQAHHQPSLIQLPAFNQNWKQCQR